MAIRFLPLLLVSGLLAATAPAALVNRWSFNEAGEAPGGTVFSDAVSAVPLQVRGNGATLNGSRLTLPGTTNCDQPDTAISAYLNLPNGIASSKTSLTVEIWAAPLSARFYQPLWDLGRMNIPGDGAGAVGEWTGTTPATVPGSETSDGIALLVNRDTNLNTQRQGSRIDGGAPLYLDSNLATAAGTTYHYVFTFQDTAGGGTVSWYRNGALVTTGSVAFHLSNLEDVNNWLGRSQWNNLAVVHAAYDEVRLYDHALTAAEVTASQAAGPNASFSPPVLQPDSATLHHRQKVRVAVLANDGAGTSTATVEVVTPPASGTAVPDANGRILYTHTTGTPAADSFTYRVNSAFGFSNPVAVTLNFATTLRIPNSTLNVPAAPPVTTIAVADAFSGFTFNQPVNMATAPGDSARLWVVERQGNIRLIPNAAAPSSPVTFLNLNTVLSGRGESLGNTVDRGLMSMALHPQYATSGYFYIWYNVQVTPNNYFWRVSRFTRSSPNTADAASERILIQQADPNGYHMGTDLHFGPDGYLYVSLGDGGGQNDSRQVSQRIDQDFWSAILRIDVDKRPGNPEPNIHASVPRDVNGNAYYSVPTDNPYVTTGGAPVSFNGANYPATSVRTEFYAVGQRNPWRFSFDGTDLWCGDVGQVTYEEVNLITSGGNYGWSFREGTVDGPQMWRAPAGFMGAAPVYQYGNPVPGSYNRSITGGFVYHGAGIPSLTGAYIFADYMTGDISSLRRNGASVTVERVAGEGGVVAFAADPSNGDILIADIGDGRIRRLTTGGTDPGFPQTLTATNLFADVTTLSPAPGLLPYEPNLSFWSDHAIKRRWFIIPGAETMTWSREGAWMYPNGMIWVKHFDLETTRGVPITAQRIETRVLVKNAAGSYGVSYRWNPAQTEATLVPDAGEDIAINVIENGNARLQTYRIPGRAQCISCHNQQAGHALSFNTRQLNRAESIHGFTGNQLSLLRDAGYLSNTPDSPNLLPRHLRPDEIQFSVEARVRSYLDVNCANCHQPGGTATPSWDGRAHLTLAGTMLINGFAANNNGNPDNRLIVPGDTTHSIVLNRVATTNGFTRMPPLGSNELDQSAISLLTEWIGILPARQTYYEWRIAQFNAEDSPEGEPDADADADGADNTNEYLAGTNPLNGASVLAPEFTAPGTLRFTVPANRPWQIETSTDLLNWSLLDVPGNNGLPRAGGPTLLNIPVVDARRAFRLRLWEN